MKEFQAWVEDNEKILRVLHADPVKWDFTKTVVGIENEDLMQIFFEVVSECDKGRDNG